MSFDQHQIEINLLKNRIESLESENRQLKKGYQTKLSNYIKTSYSFCPSCSKKIMQ